jgi:hypothetical protein
MNQPGWHSRAFPERANANNSLDMLIVCKSASANDSHTDVTAESYRRYSLQLCQGDDRARERERERERVCIKVAP